VCRRFKSDRPYNFFTPTNLTCIMNMDVVRLEDDDLSEEEREMVDRIGAENLDYCAAAILQERHPNKQIKYSEQNQEFTVDGDSYNPDFELHEEVKEERDLNGYETVSRTVQTLELLLELTTI